MDLAVPQRSSEGRGTDEAGRRQYLYHEQWRRQRDEAKFDRVIEMAAKLATAWSSGTTLLRRRRGEPLRLLCHKERRRWVPLQPADVNEHIRELFGLEVTAKDFRTWHATVHVATELGHAEARSRTARSKAVRSAVVGASELLGNTPTVCRSSYVDPRVIDLYESDVTITDAMARLPADRNQARDHLDRAVVDLLAG